MTLWDLVVDHLASVGQEAPQLLLISGEPPACRSLLVLDVEGRQWNAAMPLGCPFPRRPLL
eukprot:3430236-Amphidinium_carterae.1